MWVPRDALKNTTFIRRKICAKYLRENIHLGTGKYLYSVQNYLEVGLILSNWRTCVLYYTVK